VDAHKTYVCLKLMTDHVAIRGGIYIGKIGDLNEQHKSSIYKIDLFDDIKVVYKNP